MLYQACFVFIQILSGSCSLFHEVCFRNIVSITFPSVLTRVCLTSCQQNFCKAVAALLHFFVLAAFGWMLCEGILLYILLIRVFDGVRGKHWKIFNFIGWGKWFGRGRPSISSPILLSKYTSHSPRRLSSSNLYPSLIACSSPYISRPLLVI